MKSTTKKIDPPRGAEELAYYRALSVECPRCRAPAGRDCTDPRGETTRRGGAMVRTHRPRFARVEVAVRGAALAKAAAECAPGLRADPTSPELEAIADRLEGNLAVARVQELETFLRWAFDQAEALEAQSSGAPRGFLRQLAARGREILPRKRT